MKSNNSRSGGARIKVNGKALKQLTLKHFYKTTDFKTVRVNSRRSCAVHTNQEQTVLWQFLKELSPKK